MPKTKTLEKIIKPIKPIEEIEKIIEIDLEEKVLDVELAPGEEAEDADELDEDAVIDEEEVNPFGDKWEQ